MAKLIIFGTGKGADLACRYLAASREHEICGFTVQKEYLKEKEFRGAPVVDFENIEEMFPATEYWLFAPLGFQNMNKARAHVYQLGKSKNYNFISYIHPSVKATEDLQVGENCFILSQQAIDLDVKIGNNVTIWSANHIGDRSVIEDHVWMTSHVCLGGDVRIQSYCFLGMGAVISNNVTIAENCFIGSNALITQNTERNGVYVCPSTPKSPMTSDKFIKIAKID